MLSTCVYLSALILKLWSMQDNPAGTNKQGRIDCILLLKENETVGGRLVHAEVILKNTSDKVFEIVSRAHPLENLDLIVIAPSGKKISKSFYGGVFSPFFKEKVFTIQPGGSFRHSVNIYQTSGIESWTQPGVYKITAEYTYKKEKAVSKQVELKILPK